MYKGNPEVPRRNISLDVLEDGLADWHVDALGSAVGARVVGRGSAVINSINCSQCVKDVVHEFGTVIGLDRFREAKEGENTRPKKESDCAGSGIGEGQEEDKRGKKTFHGEDGGVFASRGRHLEEVDGKVVHGQ